MFRNKTWTAIWNRYNSMSEPSKASIWYVICNVLNKGIALLSTPIFTRILTEEQYGTFTIFQSWYNIILIFTSLNIFLGGYTKGLLLYREDREGFTSSLLSLTTFITCCFGVVYLCNVDFWTKVFELPPILMAAMFVELTLMPALEFWAAKERFDFKYKKFVAVSIAMTVLSLVGGVLAVLWSSSKVEARVFSDLVAKGIFCAVIFAQIMVQGKKLFVKEYWVFALKFNIPLLPHYLSNYVLNQSDRIMIGRMVGNDKAAHYSVVYTIATVALLIVTAINNSLTPYIYKSIDEMERGNDSHAHLKHRIEHVTTPLFVLVAALCILTMAFAPEVILIFAGRKYAEAIYVVPPIAASVFFIYLYSMFSTIEYYYQKSMQIAIATTICGALNLALNYVFIAKYGYYAAGYTTLVCYMCLSLIHYIFYKSVLRKEMSAIEEIYDIRKIAVTSLAVLAIMLVMVFTYEYTVVRYLIIAVLAAIGVWKRKYLMDVLGSFLKK